MFHGKENNWTPYPRTPEQKCPCFFLAPSGFPLPTPTKPMEKEWKHFQVHCRSLDDIRFPGGPWPHRGVMNNRLKWDSMDLWTQGWLGEEGEVRMNWQSHIDIYTLPCIKQIACGKLLYTTGSWAQCSVMTQQGGMGVSGREAHKGGGMCMHRADPHCCTAEIKQHCKATLLLLLLLSCFSRVRLCATPQTAAHQAPHPWDSPGKNTGVGSISFSNAWKWKVKVKSLSRVRLLATLWTAA